MKILIDESTYMDLRMRNTGNGFADMILPILRQKKEEGDEVVLVDDTGAIIERL